jgi:hypothetical protein
VVETNHILHSNGVRKARRDDSKKLISGSVTEGVVDQLEAVQIDVEQGELFAFPLGSRQSGREAIIELSPVSEPAQIVNSRPRLGLYEALHVVGRVLADRKNP